MINKYLLLLGIIHLLGDFYFQNEKMAKDKDKKYQGVLIHSLEYYGVALLVMLIVFNWDMFLAVSILALMHFVIDSVKYILLAKKKIIKSGMVFVYDQCAHIVSILVLAYIMDFQNFTMGHIQILEDFFNAYSLNIEKIVRWIAAVLFVHVPVNIFIQNFLEDYKPRGNSRIIKADNKAGRKIGTVERLIMLIFLSKNQYAAIGFVLTAKSIARYDKITKNEDFAEYYLLGTLVSTLCVIVCRMLVF